MGGEGSTIFFEFFSIDQHVFSGSKFAFLTSWYIFDAILQLSYSNASRV